MQRPLSSLMTFGRIAIACCWISAGIAYGDGSPEADVAPLKAPAGFEVTLFADDRLAHDIFSLTFDARGRVVVSGPGYVRILHDKDGDGRADAFTQFADGPASGAQGLCFFGNDLLCTGDAGLIRYRDRDGDDRADGPPETFLKLKTGSEHHVHSIQKGPDGWWYLMAGNMSGVTSAFASLPSSPVRRVESGAVLRFQPDLSQGEIVCDGLRNAYDFAFNSQGDLFTYDSDGEREVTLPWYRPTRVFHLTPGSHAGWISESFKWPNSFPEMPTTIAEFGRGSPTGVACYQHRRFPKEYHGAIFVADWTYGRVMALPLRPAGSGYASQPIRFLTALDQFGFAPTDMEVGPDGALYISTGGRGTRGAVFRVAYRDPSEPDAGSQERSDLLSLCLAADQPLSSWSRAAWEPRARELGREKLLTAACGESLPSGERVRAIEIVTEMFGGLDSSTLLSLQKSVDASVRARAVWSWGRQEGRNAASSQLLPFFSDEHPVVRRSAYEALYRLPVAEFGPLIAPLLKGLSDRDPGVRNAVMRQGNRLSPEVRDRLLGEANKQGLDAAVSARIAFCQRPTTLDLSALDTALLAFERKASVETRHLAARLLQLGLGDLGPTGKLPALFDGYTARQNLTSQERELDPIRVRLAQQFPTGDGPTDDELGRVISALSPYNSDLFQRILNRITPESHPTDDIHWLIVAARIPVERTSAQRGALAKAFTSIDPKVAARKLPQDTDWSPRMTELYRAHVTLDPQLPTAVIREPAFGSPGHSLLLNGVPREFLSAAIQRFVDRAAGTPDFAWTADLIFVLSESPNPTHREVARSQYEQTSLRPAVILALAGSPEEMDRSRFLDGLDSGQIEVVAASVNALSKLQPDRAATTQFALYRTARRLGGEPRERVIRDSIVRLLLRNTEEPLPFPYGEPEGPRQAAALQAWGEALTRLYPAEAERQQKAAAAQAESLQKLLADVRWESGEQSAGKAVFEKRQCGQCHGGVRAVGPDLAGVTRRFSRDDVLTAILDPDRDVSPRYQTTLIQTTAGKVHTGLVIYQSVDGLLLRTAANQTLRFETADIEERKTLKQSLMPQGLLKEATAQEVADLYAYLKSLAGPMP